MQQGSINRVRTDKDTQFTGALAQNAIAYENVVPSGSIAAGGHCRSRLHSISILSDQNLAWEVQLYATNRFDQDNSDLDTVPFLGKWSFQAGDGVQNAGAGPYIYYIDGLDIPYHCTDFDDHSTFVAGVKRPQGQIHVALVNRSATAKNAGATGEIVIQLGFEITQGI